MLDSFRPRTSRANEIMFHPLNSTLNALICSAVGQSRAMLSRAVAFPIKFSIIWSIIKLPSSEVSVWHFPYTLRSHAAAHVWARELSISMLEHFEHIICVPRVSEVYNLPECILWNVISRQTTGRLNYEPRLRVHVNEFPSWQSEWRKAAHILCLKFCRAKRSNDGIASFTSSKSQWMWVHCADCRDRLFRCFASATRPN